mmetsp:Transcript_65471/g.213103  ORF Transcript_65471/g.213103 Transcript_65471/m.213103 type:complete len:84 (+) Transcript_65471:58-309(+)
MWSASGSAMARTPSGSANQPRRDLAGIRRVMRVQVDVFEETYDRADAHHDEKVNSDMVSPNYLCGMVGQSAMTSASESDHLVD